MRRAFVAAVPALLAAVVCVHLATASASGAAGAAIPATLQPLLAKMRQLQVNSERFSEVSRGYLTVANEANGRIVGRVKHISLDLQLMEEASLTPYRSETFIGPRRTPRRIVIGSTVYSRERGKRRPWVRRHEPELAQPLDPYPFHGDPQEVALGGTGGYAGLLNLLATAVGQIGSGKASVIRGQPTEPFSATVEPLRLVAGVTEEDESNLRQHPVLERLEVWLTAEGLPIKVVQTIHSADVHETTTTEILAVNTPIDIKAPPARETKGPPRHR